MMIQGVDMIKPDLEAEAFAIAVGSLDVLPAKEHVQALLNAVVSGRLVVTNGVPVLNEPEQQQVATA